MRFNSKYFVKRSIRRHMNKGVEGRDGILWEIDEEERLCRVRIQGSGENVVCTYPKNYRMIPSWMKVGNAVHVSHRAGVRGYCEIKGEGRAIPSPVSGGEAYPDTGNSPDMILSGMDVTLDNGMIATISSGTYRIGGEIYFFAAGDAFVIDTDAEVFGPMDSGFSLPMDSSSTSVTLDPAPSVGSFRYDAFVIGTDGELDYLVGLEAAANPVKPTVPGNHILVGDYILVVGGVTGIIASDMGRDWSEPYVSYLDVAYDNQSLLYFGEVPNRNPLDGTATVTAKNQYDWTQSVGVDNGITVELVSGNGILSVLGSDVEQGETASGTWNTSISLTYERDPSGMETIPAMLVEVEANDLQTTVVFYLFDEDDNPV